LSAVGTIGFDAIVGPDRNIKLLLLIAVEISEQETKSAVGVFEPAFKRPGDACARTVGWL